jgi:hypothetical protein
LPLLLELAGAEGIGAEDHCLRRLALDPVMMGSSLELAIGGSATPVSVVDRVSSPMARVPSWECSPAPPKVSSEEDFSSLRDNRL